jgi:hypothetical protein
MVDRDRVLRDLDSMSDGNDGSVAIITPRRVAAPPHLLAAEERAQLILERYLEDTPPGPHPHGRHDRFEAILARSPFPHLEAIEHKYESAVHPTMASLVGCRYTVSRVISQLGDRRAAFEDEVQAALGNPADVGTARVTLHDEALIGRRRRVASAT